MPKIQHYFFCALLFLGLCFSACETFAEGAPGNVKNFTHFGMTLPPGWDGDEQSGFISDNRDEYMISLAKKSEDGESYTAQLSIYLLPNTAGQDSQAAARRLAEAQADASEPVKEGEFWVFTGEPRTTIVRGPARTMARATPEKMLIIISQGAEDEARAILASLHGLTDEARSMLGSQGISF